MKQYVIDELRPEDYEKIKAYLDAHLGPGQLDGIYWIPLEENLLNDVQAAHTECKPFYLAIELESNRLACELLIRTTNRVRCQCMGYANEKQRNWIIAFVDAVFEKLELKT
jgi:hypothetical protein